MGNYYLKPGGFDFHPMNNDFAGQTDKLMTGSASAGFLRNYSDSSVDVGIKWRMVTPIFKSVFGEPDLKIPIGRFADWGELEIAYARLFAIGSQLFKWQLDVGLNDVGNKGGRELHLFVHKLTGSSLNQLEYNSQPTGFTVSRGGQLGLLGENYSRWGSEFQSQYAVGMHFSKFMNEA